MVYTNRGCSGVTQLSGMWCSVQQSVPCRGVFGAKRSVRPKSPVSCIPQSVPLGHHHALPVTAKDEQSLLEYTTC
jgi:hypothetical protein